MRETIKSKVNEEIKGRRQQEKKGKHGQVKRRDGVNKEERGREREKWEGGQA